MAQVWDGSPTGAGHALNTQHLGVGIHDGPIPSDPIQKPKQHSTLLKVTEAYCSDDKMDMSLLSTKKLAAHSHEQGQIAKRVNLVHRISETNCFDALESEGFKGNVADRTMDLVKILSALDQFKLRHRLLGPTLSRLSDLGQGEQQTIQAQDSAEAPCTGGSNAQEGDSGVALEQHDPGAGGHALLGRVAGTVRASALLQRPWQVRLLQVEQQQQQQQEQHCGEQLPAHAAPVPEEEEDRRPTESSSRPGSARLLEGEGPPYTAHAQWHPLPEQGSPLYAPVQLPANLNSLRLLSSPDARYLLLCMAEARERPGEFVLESWGRARKVPVSPGRAECAGMRVHVAGRVGSSEQQQGSEDLQQQQQQQQQQLPAGLAQAGYARAQAGGNQGPAGGVPPSSAGVLPSPFQATASMLDEEDASAGAGAVGPGGSGSPPSCDQNLPGPVLSATGPKAAVAAAAAAAERPTVSPQLSAPASAQQAGAAAAAAPAQPEGKGPPSPATAAGNVTGTQALKSQAVAPSPANAAKRATHAASGKGKRGKRSKLPSKRGMSPHKPKSSEGGQQKSAKSGASHPSSTLTPKSPSALASSPQRTGTGARSRVASSRTIKVLKGGTSKEGETELPGVFKPMAREAIGADGVDIVDPGALKDEMARRRTGSLQALAECNPAGFNGEEAASEVATFSEAAQRSRHVLAITQDLPCDVVSDRALWSAMQELHFRRPFLAMPELRKLGAGGGGGSAMQSARQHALARACAQGGREREGLGSANSGVVTGAVAGTRPGALEGGPGPWGGSGGEAVPHAHLSQSLDLPAPGPASPRLSADDPGPRGGSVRARGGRPGNHSPGTRGGSTREAGMPVPEYIGLVGVGTSPSGGDWPVNRAAGVGDTAGLQSGGLGSSASAGGVAGTPDSSAGGGRRALGRGGGKPRPLPATSSSGAQLQPWASVQPPATGSVDEVEAALYSAPGSALADEGSWPQPVSNRASKGGEGWGWRGDATVQRPYEEGREEGGVEEDGERGWQKVRRLSTASLRSKKRESGELAISRRVTSVKPSLLEEEEGEVEPPGWNAHEHSLFASRALTSDAHDILDTAAARLEQLRLDWQRIVVRHPFRCYMALEAHPPPLIELPHPPEEEPEEQAFTFQRLMALHAAASQQDAATAATTSIATHPSAHPHADDTTAAAAPKPAAPTSTPPTTHPSTTSSQPPPLRSRPLRSPGDGARADSTPLPHVSKTGTPASLHRDSQQRQRQRQQASYSNRPVGSPGQAQSATPRLPRLPTAAERTQQAIQQRPALEWHTESWLQVQEQSPGWTPGRSLPQLQANTRQQKRTAAAPPSSLLPPLPSSPDESAQALREKVEALEQVLSKARGVLEQHHALLLSVFASYALVVHGDEGPEPGLMLPRAAWVALLEDCGILDAACQGAQAKQYLDAFEHACYGQHPLPVQSPPRDMLLRFEFYEALIRVAVAKYVKPGHCREVHESLEALITGHLQANLSEDMLHEPNTFRESLLYTHSIDATLRESVPMLYALHALACAESNSTFLKLGGWIELLQACGIIGLHVGVSIPDASAIFTRSQQVVVDEVKRYWRVCGLDDMDFLEALCRVAALLDPPLRPELLRRLRECLGVSPEHLLSTMAGNPYHTYYSKLALQPESIKAFETEEVEAGAPSPPNPQQLQPKAGELKLGQEPQQEAAEQQQQQQQQQTPVQALRHKLGAMLDLIWGGLHAKWGTNGDSKRLLELMNARIQSSLKDCTPCVELPA